MFNKVSFLINIFNKYREGIQTWFRGSKTSADDGATKNDKTIFTQIHTPSDEEKNC